MKGYVYLLCNPNQELYKIGVTTGTIEKRIKQLQTGNGTPIHITNYYKTDYPFKLEKMLHLTYSSRRVHNEWFALTHDDIVEWKSQCQKLESDLLFLIENNPFVK